MDVNLDPAPATVQLHRCEYVSPCRASRFVFEPLLLRENSTRQGDLFARSNSATATPKSSP